MNDSTNSLKSGSSPTRVSKHSFAQHLYRRDSILGTLLQPKFEIIVAAIQGGPFNNESHSATSSRRSRIHDLILAFGVVLRPAQSVLIGPLEREGEPSGGDDAQVDVAVAVGHDGPAEVGKARRTNFALRV
jgi:hypothetical protein